MGRFAELLGRFAELAHATTSRLADLPETLPGPSLEHRPTRLESELDGRTSSLHSEQDPRTLCRRLCDLQSDLAFLVVLIADNAFASNDQAA